MLKESRDRNHGMINRYQDSTAQNLPRKLGTRISFYLVSSICAKIFYVNTGLNIDSYINFRGKCHHET